LSNKSLSLKWSNLSLKLKQQLNKRSEDHEKIKENMREKLDISIQEPKSLKRLLNKKLKLSQLNMRPRRNKLMKECLLNTSP
jgi:hypothetical protein